MKYYSKLIRSFFPPYKWKDDLTSNIRLQKEINNQKCELVAECYRSFESYIKEVAGCEYFIGQKLHSTIIATMCRIPSIMIGYRPKNLDYMKSINMEKYLLPISDFTKNGALLLLDKLFSDSDRVQMELDKEITNLVKIQKEWAKKLQHFFEKSFDIKKS